MEEWLNLLTDYGFPAVIVIYLLARFEKKLESLTKAITDLIHAVKERK